MKHTICPVFDLKEQFFTLNNFNICISILKITLVRLGERSLNLTELILGASGFLFPQVKTAEELPTWFLGVDTNRLVFEAQALQGLLLVIKAMNMNDVSKQAKM
jgi:hypothetical protein